MSEFSDYMAEAADIYIANRESALRSQISLLNEDLTDINAELSRVVQLVTEQDTELLKKTTRISELESEVQTLEARIEELENQTPDSADLPGWGLPVWRDEFDSEGLDLDRWNARDNTTVSYDQAVIYRANNKVPGDGFLHQVIDRIPTVNRAGRQRYFSVGYLDTIGKFSQRYGRWEIRCKLPLTPGKSKALWPAFWLRDASGTGECDIMEAIGTPHTKQSVHPEGVTSMTIHQDTGHAAGTVKIEKKPSPSEVYIADGEFHTFAVEWTPEGFRFLVDGVERWFPKTAQYGWFETSFPAGCNIRLNCQVGEGWMGFYDDAHPETTVTPVEMTVDYVRVWAYKK